VTVLLVRHTRVNVAPGICYGQHDVALLQPHDPPFDVVRAAVRAVAVVGVAAVVSSPLSRAAQLAAHIASDVGVFVQTNAAFLELDFGDWEGRAWSDIPRAESDPWSMDYHRLAPPRGETHAALTARVCSALDVLAAQHQHDTVVVVTHAGPIRVALARGRGLRSDVYPDIAVSFGSVVVLPESAA
jgi:alpha-ribazole phosphatase